MSELYEQHHDQMLADDMRAELEAKDKLIAELVEALEYVKPHLPVWTAGEDGKPVLWLHMSVESALSKAK